MRWIIIEALRVLWSTANPLRTGQTRRKLKRGCKIACHRMLRLSEKFFQSIDRPQG